MLSEIKVTIIDFITCDIKNSDSAGTTYTIKCLYVLNLNHQQIFLRRIHACYDSKMVNLGEIRELHIHSYCNGYTNFFYKQLILSYYT